MGIEIPNQPMNIYPRLLIVNISVRKELSLGDSIKTDPCLQILLFFPLTALLSDLCASPENPQRSPCDPPVESSILKQEGKVPSRIALGSRGGYNGRCWGSPVRQKKKHTGNLGLGFTTLLLGEDLWWLRGFCKCLCKWGQHWGNDCQPDGEFRLTSGNTYEKCFIHGKPIWTVVNILIY